MGRTVLGICLLVLGLVLLWNRPLAWWLPQWVAVIPLAGAMWCTLIRLRETEHEADRRGHS